MSDNIVGYVDRSKIKGQYYRYAGSPIPTVFTGDFDTISEDLLAKAMFVTKDGSSASTFPTDSYDSYLLTTTKFGNEAYLQNAFSVTFKVDYARIYTNGSWSEWVTSNAGNVDDQIKTLNGKINAIYNPDNGTGKLVDLSKDLGSLDTDPSGRSGTGKVPTLITSVNNLITATVPGLSNSLANKIQQVTLSRLISMNNSHETNGYFQLDELNYPNNGNSVLIGMRVNTSSVGKLNGTIYMLTYASNGTKPYIGYQKASGVTFDKVAHDFIFTFYVP